MDERATRQIQTRARDEIASKESSVLKRAARETRELVFATPTATLVVGVLVWTLTTAITWKIAGTQSAKDKAMEALISIWPVVALFGLIFVVNALWFTPRRMLKEADQVNAELHHELDQRPLTEGEVFDQWVTYFCAGRELSQNLRASDSPERISAFKRDAKRWMDETRKFASLHLKLEQYRTFLSHWPEWEDMREFHETVLADREAAELARTLFARSKAIGKIANIIE